MCWAVVILSFLSWQNPNEMDYLLSKIPDVTFKTSDSSAISISSWYSKKPVLLTLAYGRCPGVCNPYLLQIRDQISMLGAEKEFQMVVLSFDPEDSPKQLWRLAGFNENNPPPANWTFGVLEAESRAALLTSLGLKTQTVGGLYDHNTVLALIGEDGSILQWIEGLPGTAQWNRLFKELKSEFVPVYSTLNNNVWTSCFQYDPASGTWRMSWGLLMILGPALITFFIIIILQSITRNDRTKNNSSILIQNQL